MSLCYKLSQSGKICFYTPPPPGRIFFKVKRNHIFLVRYYRGSDQGYHNGLCCVVTVVEGNHGFTKEDLSCLSSDRPDDLKRCSENREEIVVASVVKIIPRDGFQFVMDVRIYSILGK